MEEIQVQLFRDISKKEKEQSRVVAYNHTYPWNNHFISPKKSKTDSKRN